MPGEIEVPLEHAQAHIEDVHEELHGEHKSGEHKSGEHKSGEHKPGEEKHTGKEKDGWTRFIAVTTALLAVVAAIGALRAGLLVNEALLAKNNEISLRTQATDQWNYYQSKSIKGVIYATTAQLLPPGSPQEQKSQSEVLRYGREQTVIQDKAEELERTAEEKDHESARDMDRHHIFAFSVSLCQIAIALSAVAALTRSRPVWIFGLASGIAGVAALLGGFLGLHLPFAF